MKGKLKDLEEGGKSVGLKINCEKTKSLRINTKNTTQFSINKKEH